MVKIKNLKKRVLELLPKRVSLVYIDYNDSIEDYKVLNRAVKENSLECIQEYCDDWICDAQYESIKYLEKELISDLESKFDIEEWEAEEIVEKYEFEIRDKLYERDDSNPVKELVQKSGDEVFFYDTGVTMPGYGESAGTYRLARREVKKTFGIKDGTHDRAIDSMIREASYGGNLVVYFNATVDQLVTENEDDFNQIEFTDPHIAIIDTGGGSGFDTELPGHSFSLPFTRDNLFMDRAVSYSYTYEVCGMSSNWCQGTKFVLQRINDTEQIKSSSINGHMEQERMYDETYNKGKCTAGDMKMSRHRNVTYINDYPCGNTCKDCGTFWID